MVNLPRPEVSSLVGLSSAVDSGAYLSEYFRDLTLSKFVMLIVPVVVYISIISGIIRRINDAENVISFKDSLSYVCYSLGIFFPISVLLFIIFGITHLNTVKFIVGLISLFLALRIFDTFYKTLGIKIKRVNAKKLAVSIFLSIIATYFFIKIDIRIIKFIYPHKTS